MDGKQNVANTANYLGFFGGSGPSNVGFFMRKWTVDKEQKRCLIIVARYYGTSMHPFTRGNPFCIKIANVITGSDQCSGTFRFTQSDLQEGDEVPELSLE